MDQEAWFIFFLNNEEHNALELMAPAGFEPATHGLGNQRSIP